MLVDHTERLEFEEFAANNIREMLQESHEIGNGSLEKYSEDHLHYCVTLPTAEGTFECKPYSEQDSWPMLLYSPPPVNFGSMLYDCLGVPDYKMVTLAMAEARSTVLSNVRPSWTTAGSGLSHEEHEAMHSRLPNSHTSYPHSVIVTPIFEIPNVNSSKVVGLLGGGFAWDFALRNLLPEGVRGIFVVLSNTCRYCFLGFRHFELVST